MAGNKNSGRRPTPRAIKEARGTIRPDRDGEPGEVVDLGTPEPGTTPAPDWLDKESRGEWARVVPLLERARVLSAADYSQLASYCAAHGQAVKAQRRLNREGLTVRRGNGSIAANPLITVAKESRSQALRIAIEYGLTPAARTRISEVGDAPNIPDAPTVGAPTAAEKFLFGGKPPAPLQLVPTATKANGEKP